ncbi:acyltransferase domain-containing protein [Myxococcus sp. K38C18041901]|uniref:type I polyketide synthase n=1 Tax=Myxococcus guangdongensis TaxID=2906760 RepID=UPI0020A81F7D|nr:type I polyketide synthase [Myxococcus guangdongensis]MCP3063707.1 acyltransferase domain-containing protein [Myxococcus guangdongensis]
MSDVMEKLVRGLSPEKRVNLARMLLRSVGESVAEKKTAEPIAIIGIGCRFPGGANDADSFWRMLRAGTDAVGEVPPSRWDIDAYYDADPSKPGKMYTRNGAFLEGVDLFDPYFFGIPPRSAVNMDPQHRLLLEVAWEALEHAGIAPQSLAGSKTGVFIGGATGDYTQLIQGKGADSIDASYLTGSLLTFATGRLSHFFDLQGPSLGVDTACSSSLVAVHLACQSLRSGESSLSLVGGVNLILTPQGTITTCKARMLAVDGRCKTFDAAADGYGRGEGCGMVVLKRLSEALADGDQVLAVIRGSAVNQDGHSSDLTVPNGLAQQAVIRQALADAGLDPKQVGYVEAHGTGTSLGDPIELRALGAVFGEKRDGDAALQVGSVKTNIGHLEYAAGIAGLIKLVLSLKHGEVPAHLHFKRGNPYIPWNELPVAVPTQLAPWAARDGKRVGGVSSFGASGTNAHVVLEEAPEVERKGGKERPRHVLALSARNEKALRELAGRYAKGLGEEVGDACFTANTGRARFGHRVAVVGRTGEELKEELARYASGGAVEKGAEGQAKKAEEVVLLFTGQGVQHEGMGRELYETSETFRGVMKQCDEVVKGELGESLVEVLYGGKGVLLEKSSVSQAALFSVEYALAEVWREWGVKPAAVMGHSLGEYVAACVAGVFSLEEGLKLVMERGRLMEGLEGEGKMVAVLASEEEVKGEGGERLIAAVNGPGEVVLAGRVKEVEEVEGRLKARGKECRALKTTHAFHSELMEPMKEGFERAAGKVEMQRAKLELVSNVSGREVKGEEREAGYWARHLREPVRYWEGVKGLYERGYRVFVEVGPKPTLTGVGKRYLGEGEAQWVGSLRVGSSDWEMLLGSAAKLYVKGVEVDWEGVDKGYARRRVALPTYPFQRERYWLDSLIPNTDVLVTFYRTIVQLAEVNTAVQFPSLRFATLREPVPGFSWIAMYRPEADPAKEAVYKQFYDLALQSNLEMARTLYRGLDFSSFTRVLDIGCGHAADLIDLGKAHPHLELHGCNISPDQIEAGRQRIRGLGLDGRIKLHYQDSSRDAFPSTYDLVIAFQVIHHIRNKADLFANISRSLRNGGYLVMAETLSNMASAIEHPESTTLFVPQAEWAELLARNHLRIVEAVESSQEIANFLHDPDFEQNFTRVTRDLDEVTQKHLHGIHMLGELLKRRLAAYLLFTVTKDESMDVDTIRRINLERLGARVSYDATYSAVTKGPYALPPPPGAQALQDAASAASTFAKTLLSTEPGQRGPLLDGYLREQVANLLKMPVARLDAEQPLSTLGLDSLLSLELKHKIHAETGVSLQLDELLQGASIAHLSQRLAEQLDGRGAGRTATTQDWEEGEL